MKTRNGCKNVSIDYRHQDGPSDILCNLSLGV